MKRSWFIWVTVAAVIITVLFAFNYQSGKDEVPLNEIFSEESSYPVEVEYEFVEDAKTVKPGVSQTEKDASQKLSPYVQPIGSESKTTAVTETTGTVKKAETVQAAAVLAKVSAENSDLPLSEIKWAIQTASFKEKNRADQVLNNLKNSKLDAYILTKDLGSKGVWYRVYVGKFLTKSQAQAVLPEVQKLYKDSFIISFK